METITKEERGEINEELYLTQDNNQIITICDYVIVCTCHFSTLCPGVWLNDDALSVG